MRRARVGRARGGPSCVELGAGGTGLAALYVAPPGDNIVTRGGNAAPASDYVVTKSDYIVIKRYYIVAS